MKETPTDTNDTDLLKGLRHPQEFDAYINWIATPEVLREPKTQKELAVYFGVGQEVLSHWKHRDHFWDEVRNRIRESSKERTADILHGLYKKARNGNAPEVKLWLQYVEGFSEKSQLDQALRTFVIVDGHNDLDSSDEVTNNTDSI